MSLDVRRENQATKDYEYSFFDEFSGNLVNMFEQEGLEGVLIGFPEVPENENLYPDCVLITENRIVIIDFKKYAGEIYLSDEYNFENYQWKTTNGLVVEGGSSINPFAQLRKQEQRLETILGYSTYDSNRIACVVCFQDEMKIKNKVPRKHEGWFSVINKYQYLDRIRDIVTIKNPNKNNIEEVSSHFNAKPYRKYQPISGNALKEASEAYAKLETLENEKIKLKNELNKTKEELEKISNEKENTDRKKNEIERLHKEIKEREAEILKQEELVKTERKKFDDKKNELELEKQKALKAQAEAQKSQAEERKAIAEEKIVEKAAEISKNKSKTIIIISAVVAAVVLIVASIFVFKWLVDKDEEKKNKDNEVAQLEEDYKNGRKCIPVERVSEFYQSKNVCVDYYVGYVDASPKYVFADAQKNGIFAAMIPKTLISESDANKKYRNKHIQVRGDITKYEDTYEIKVYNLNQITVLD